MTKTELRKAKADLKRLNAFIAKHEIAEGNTEIEVYVNAKNAEFGDYSFVKIPKTSTELRKQIKALRWGRFAHGKARWNKDEVAWSVLTSALEGTVFGK
ncbi:hypothetical protein LCGC14_0209600 [marine sediment metagenome]|uniref:Uncharacterized protein n=1 Tax=marine sediment metagenome TaxID=412755 RepID=A0A0F9ULH8_9ZZZZ